MEWIAPNPLVTATAYPSFPPRRFITVPLTYSDLKEPCGSTRTNGYGTQTLPAGITTVINGSTYADLNMCQPTLYVADVVSNLAPGWENCKPLSYGVWDPPIALKSQNQLEIIQVPAPSAVADRQPEKVTQSEGMVLTTASEKPSAQQSPAPVPSWDPHQPIQTQSISAHTSSAGSTSNADAAPSSPSTDSTQPTQRTSDLPSRPALSNQPVPAPEPSFQHEADPAHLTNPADASPTDPTNLKDPASSLYHTSQAAALPPIALVIGSITTPITVLPSAAGVIVGTQTLSLNGPALTIANVPISLTQLTSGFPVLVAGPSIIPLTPLLPSPTLPVPGLSAQPSIYLLPGTRPAVSLDVLTLVRGGSTLKLAPGLPAATMTDGEVVSAAGSGVIMVVSAGRTTMETLTAPSSGAVTLDGVIWSAFGGAVPTDALDLVAGASTLKLAPGLPAATMADGEVVSAAGSGVVMVVSAGRTSMETLTAQSSGVVGLGGVIWSAFAAAGTTGMVTAASIASNATGDFFFTGGAKRERVERMGWVSAGLGLSLLGHVFG